MLATTPLLPALESIVNCYGPKAEFSGERKFVRFKGIMRLNWILIQSTHLTRENDVKSLKYLFWLRKKLMPHALDIPPPFQPDYVVIKFDK